MDSFSIEDAMALLDKASVQTSNDLSISKLVAKKNYRELRRHWNVTSYSQLEEFHRCPRYFQLQKHGAANQSITEELLREESVHFAFGHAVGAGAADFLHYRDVDKAKLTAMLAWSADFFAEIPKKKKNIWGALLAVDCLAASISDLLDEWEVLVLPNGQPAIEVSLSLHCGNDFKHYLHLDIAMRNKRSGRIGVFDVKTHGFDRPEAAIYQNSSQTVSYSIVLQAALQEEIHEYEVFYLTYSSTERQWDILPFTKNMVEQAEAVKDLLLTQQHIREYEELNFYPKRGQSCFDYFRRCRYFGECDSTPAEGLSTLDSATEAEQPDYVVSIESVVAAIKARRKVV